MNSFYMQEIREILMLLQQYAHQRQSIDLATQNPDLALFYQRISQRFFVSDTEDLTGVSDTHPMYTALKISLQNTLLVWSGAFNAELNISDDYHYVYRECNKQWLAIQCLTGQNVCKISLPLAQQLLDIVEKFELTQLCIELNAFLRIQYCLGNHRDKQRCVDAGRRQQYYLKVYDAEYRAKRQYTELNIQAADSTISREKISRLAQEAHKQIEMDMHQYNSFELTLYGYLLKILHYSTANKHQNVLTCSSEAIQVFTRKPYSANTPLQVFYYMELIAHIQLKQFSAGMKSLENCLLQVENGDFNWFKFKELGLSLMLHTGEYTQAVDLFNETINHPKLPDLPEYALHLWEIHRTYLKFLHQAGVVAAAPETGRLPKRLALAGPNLDPTENTGLCTALLILEWLSTFQEKRYDELCQKSEQIRQYVDLYLKGTITKRSYYFLKILGQFSCSNLAAWSTGSQVPEYLTKLRENPVQMAHQTAETEIIPFEDLWQLVLK